MLKPFCRAGACGPPYPPRLLAARAMSWPGRLLPARWPRASTPPAVKQTVVAFFQLGELLRVRGTARAAEEIVEGALVALGGRPARVIVLQDCSSVGAIALWDQPLREQLLGAMDLTSLAALSAARSSLSRVADWILGPAHYLEEFRLRRALWDAASLLNVFDWTVRVPTGDYELAEELVDRAVRLRAIAVSLTLRLRRRHQNVVTLNFWPLN